MINVAVGEVYFRKRKPPEDTVEEMVLIVSCPYQSSLELRSRKQFSFFYHGDDLTDFLIGW